MQKELTCPQCGNKFLKRLSAISKNAKNTFCSRVCKNNWQKEKKINQHLKKRLIIKCTQCEKEIERTPAHIREINFCSRNCFTKWKSENWRGKSSPFWKGRSNIISCDICGIPIKRYESEMNKRKKHFCSHECFSVWKSQQKGEKSNRWNGGKIKVSCACCGNELERIRSEVEKRSENFFCDTKCHAKWRSANVTGSIHPNWRGGWKPYYGPNWQSQRRNVRVRDNFTCKECGITEHESIEKFGQKLHVHHIKPFMEFGYIEGENENYKIANSSKNLVTLCQSCHHKTEWGYRHSSP